MRSPIFDFSWGAALQNYLLVLLAAGFVGFVFAVLLAARRRGSLVDGFAAASSAVLDLFQDLAALSPRRLWAIAWHSILESIRRRMLLAVFGVLIVVFMFGGWFLESRPTEQVKVYVSFVFLSSTLIAIAAGWLLACLSLPSDISDKTIHTVMTKPVRRLEIVIGRILGLTVVTTAILVIMGVVSYVYMRRSVDGSLAELRQKLAEAEQQGDKRYEEELRNNIAEINSKLTSRVPIHGSLEGPSKNVGHESKYRYYIEGNSADAAIWRFSNLPISRFLAKQEIAIEMTFSVFRTTKGEVGKGVIAQIAYLNPKTGRQISDYPFQVREYYTDRQAINNSVDAGRHSYSENGHPLASPPAKPLEWLCQGSDGELAVVVRCLSGSQYIGMARPDLYILLDTSSFGLNFAKGMVGVWLRVFLIICVAVMFSTFLSSYVAMLATAAVFFGGMCMTYLTDLAKGEHHGGGPFEAIIRLWTHENLERSLDLGTWTEIVKSFDSILKFVVGVLTRLLPDLRFFNTSALVANGFDIGAGVLAAHIVVALVGYALPITIFAYFLLQSREIAR